MKKTSFILFFILSVFSGSLQAFPQAQGTMQNNTIPRTFSIARKNSRMNNQIFQLEQKIRKLEKQNIKLEKHILKLEKHKHSSKDKSKSKQK